MKATIITIGDEILIGQIVDTNSVSIAKHLNAAGIVVHEKVSIGDPPRTTSPKRPWPECSAANWCPTNGSPTM